MAEWQPIKTAPKDGTHFLAWEVTGPIDQEDRDGRIIARKLYRRTCAIAYFWFGGFVTYPWNGGFVPNQKFTHWMPLPEPPEDGA